MFSELVWFPGGLALVFVLLRPKRVDSILRSAE